MRAPDTYRSAHSEKEQEKETREPQVTPAVLSHTKSAKKPLGKTGRFSLCPCSFPLPPHYISPSQSIPLPLPVPPSPHSLLPFPPLPSPSHPSFYLSQSLPLSFIPLPPPPLPPPSPLPSFPFPILWEFECLCSTSHTHTAPPREIYGEAVFSCSFLIEPRTIRNSTTHNKLLPSLIDHQLRKCPLGSP